MIMNLVSVKTINQSDIIKKELVFDSNFSTDGLIAQLYPYEGRNAVIVAASEKTLIIEIQKETLWARLVRWLRFK